jgi:hypothetical protein
MLCAAKGAAQSPPNEDSLRADKRARNAQSDFEIRRRGHLPMLISHPNGTPCDDVVGRYCYWYADLVERYEDPPELKDLRNRLLRVLDSVAAQYPGNDWVAGQRIRYLIEAGDENGAIASANECHGTISWCHAVRGLALHAAGRYAEAEQSFDFALAAMPDDVRCSFTDISTLLDGSVGKEYRSKSCTERAAIEKRIWWLADPMYSIPGNDRRTEHLSRNVMEVIYSDSRLANGMRWGPDAAQILVRYGWYTFWTREPPPIGSNMSLPSITDHQATPAFHFMPAVPDPDSLENLASIRWVLQGPRLRERYAPKYLKGMFIALDPQVARFVRGDSAMLVTAYDVRGDTAFHSDVVRAAFVSAAPEQPAPSAVVRTNSARRDTMSLKTPPGLRMAGVEILSPDSEVVARSRIPIRVDAVNHNVVSLSDILLFETDGALADNLERAMSRMLGSSRVRGDRKIGLYWEIYDLKSAGTDLPVALTLTRLRGNTMERIRESLGLADKPTPISIRWTEPRSNLATAPRSLLLDLSLVPRGRYALEIALGNEGNPLTETSRVIEIR